MDIRTHLLDTSALVKLLVDEPESTIIRSYFGREPVIWLTSLSFMEALGVLKTKHYHRKEIDRDQYLAACETLVASVRDGTMSVVEVSILENGAFDEAAVMSKQYSLDLADSMQLVTLKRGFPAGLSGESRTVLVTGDSTLANCARREGFRVWNCISEASP